MAPSTAADVQLWEGLQPPWVQGSCSHLEPVKWLSFVSGFFSVSWLWEGLAPFFPLHLTDAQRGVDERHVAAGAGTRAGPCADRHGPGAAGLLWLKHEVPEQLFSAWQR